MTNVDPNQARTVNVSVRGQNVSGVTGRILTADRMNAYNSFEQPNAVRPVAFNGARLSGETVTVQLPAKSVVVLELR
jgi:alpha-N-arabinofuranosidase